MQSSMDKLFYELIQVSVGSRTVLSRVPSLSEWQMLYDLSEKQSLIGICFCGVQRIYNDNRYQAANLPKTLRMQWLGIAVKIHNRNEELNKQCVIIQQQFKEAGFNTCVLKGQGVASYYYSNLSLFRQPGDIDIWVDAPWRDVLDYVNARTPNREFDRKHTHLKALRNTIVEVHWWPSMPNNPLYRKALQAYYKEQSPIQSKHLVLLQDGTEIYAPDARFEAVHVLYHIFNHFIYEGIGLRQMMDLYFVLVNGGFTDEDRDELQITFKRIGLSTIAPAAMWVLCEVFGMEEQYSVGRADQKLGQRLLYEINKGGNFGVHSAENHILNETFAHRMKRRMRRRINLIRYNPLGVVTSPFTKVGFLIWKRKVIREYNL